MNTLTSSVSACAFPINNQNKESIFTAVFMVSFIAAPLIISSCHGNWLILVVGYAIPVIAGTCYLIKNLWKSHQQTGTGEPLPNYSLNYRNDVVYVWLQAIGLPQYEHVLVEQGYATAADLSTITRGDLEAMGITKQMHIKKILAETEHLRGSAPSTEEFEDGDENATDLADSSAPPLELSLKAKILA